MRLGDDIVDRCRRLPDALVDGLLAALLLVITLVTVAVQGDLEDQSLTALGFVLLVAQAVPLIWRRRAPLVVVAVSGAAAIAYGIAEQPDPAVMFAPLLAFYTVAAYCPRRTSVPAAIAIVVGAGAAIVFSGDSDAADITVGYFSGITAWVVGDTTRGQRERAVWLEERRADAARQAAADERIRIARDLHDVVAHHVSVIAVQAEAAQEVFAAKPDRAADAMARVADTARTALAELRRLLGVLRSDAGLTPQPDLATVDELVASVRGAGLAISLRTSGDAARAVDPVVGLTAYRVIQEALTNVLKHAGDASAEIDLEYGDDALVVTVVDDGASGGRSGDTTAPGPGRNGRGVVAGAGQGLIGMRERVAVLGGSLETGPRPDGGFSVRARLPLTG
ncbi:MAG: sensor histidine kinase [Acidimicrobiales bacterium]